MTCWARSEDMIEDNDIVQRQTLLWREKEHAREMQILNKFDDIENSFVLIHGKLLNVFITY